MDLISAGATLDTQQLEALRTILSRPTPLACPSVSQVASSASDWSRVRVTVQPNVLLAMLLVSSDGLFWFQEDCRRELDADSRTTTVRVLKEQTGIIVSDPVELIYQGREHGCDLYHLRLPAKATSVDGTWVPYLDLVAAESKGMTPGGLKLRSSNYGSTIRFQLHRAVSPNGPRASRPASSGPQRGARTSWFAPTRPGSSQGRGRSGRLSRLAPHSRHPAWHYQQLPQDPSRRKAYLKEARAFLRRTAQLHNFAIPWTAGFHPGRAPRLSPVDPVSLDMSGNGRLYRPGDIPPAALDTSSPLRLGSFSWKPTDRPQGALIAGLSGSLRVQLANITLSIPVLPADLSTGDYRAGDKVTFRHPRPLHHRGRQPQRFRGLQPTTPCTNGPPPPSTSSGHHHRVAHT